MSRIDKAEIQQELDHLNKLLTIAHNNRRVLEEQQIQQGIIAPLSLINQKNEIERSIQEYEERKNQLEIQAVEENISAAEAEYCVIAAEAWNSGYLNTLGAAQLELARLRLKIQPARAAEIEYKIRLSIVDDLFRTLNIDLLFNIQGPISGNTGTLLVNFHESSSNNGEIHLNLSQGWSLDRIIETNFITLGRCIVLDINRINILLISQMKEHHFRNIEYFKDSLLVINKVDSFSDILPSYNKFFHEISGHLPSSNS